MLVGGVGVVVVVVGVVVVGVVVVGVVVSKGRMLIRYLPYWPYSQYS